MLKLMNRLFLFLLVLLIGAGVWGYNNGMTSTNYKEFIAEKIEQLQTQLQTQKPAAKKEKKPVKKKTLAKAKTKSKSTSKSKTNSKSKESAYTLLPPPVNPFYAIDQQAKHAPAAAERDVQSLAGYLQQNAQTDLEKARSIYRWITANINYDAAAYNAQSYPNYTPQYVLENRKAICSGFSNLFSALGKEMGLEIEKVNGYAKGYGYQAGNVFSKIDHAWNVIKINGEWRIFDSTWGEGHSENVNGKMVSTKKYNDYWFNVNPYEAIFSHFPENKEDSFVQPMIALKQFEQMPSIGAGFFELGFAAKKLFLETRSNPNLRMSETFAVDTYAKVIAAPELKEMNVKQSYDFQFYIPRAYEVVVIDAKNKWTYFKRDKGNFNLTYTPKEIGELQIGIRHEKSGKHFETLLRYQVK